MKITNKYIYLILTISVCSSLQFQVYAQSERIYRDVNLYLKEERNLAEINIFTTTGLSTDAQGNIVFFDYDRGFIAHTRSGYLNEINLFGGEKGRGPGEFQNVWTTQIDTDGTIFIADLDNRRISKWSLSGELIEEIAVKKKYLIPARMVVCKQQPLIYLLSRQYWRDGLFHQYDKEGTYLRSFKKISSRNEQHAFYTGGYIACDEKGNMYHAPMYVNKIRKYSSSGQLLTERDVFGIVANSKILNKESDGWIGLHKEAKTISGYTHYIKGKLAVAFSGIRPRLFETIDFYSSEDLEYQFSLKMPNRFEAFAITEQYIVTIEFNKYGEDNWLRVYEYSGLD